MIASLNIFYLFDAHKTEFLLQEKENAIDKTRIEKRVVPT